MRVMRVFQDYAQGQTLQYFYRTLRACLSIVKLVHPTMVTKNFQIDDVQETG